MRLIDADALVCKLVIVKQDYVEESNDLLEKIVNCLIKTLQKETICPTIDAEPVRHGEWKWVFNRKADTWGDDCYESGWECSECGAGADIYISHHKVEESCEESEKGITDERTIRCHNCGAKMDGGMDNGKDD